MGAVLSTARSVTSETLLELVGCGKVNSCGAADHAPGGLTSVRKDQAFTSFISRLI